MKKIIAIVLLGASMMLLFDSCKTKRYKYKGPSKNCDCPNGQFQPSNLN
ncbi:MAG: hypothetical protein HKP14_06165 [Bacteroidia bacterium]|nr:hypothetical protein [Bacteroidia bacterium]